MLETGQTPDVPGRQRRPVDLRRAPVRRMQLQVQLQVFEPRPEVRRPRRADRPSVPVLVQGLDCRAQRVGARDAPLVGGCGVRRRPLGRSATTRRATMNRVTSS